MIELCVVLMRRRRNKGEVKEVPFIDKIFLYGQASRRYN